MAPCRTAQSNGGGIYPASEGPSEGECEVQRAFPAKAPSTRKPPSGGRPEGFARGDKPPVRRELGGT